MSCVVFFFFFFFSVEVFWKRKKNKKRGELSELAIRFFAVPATTDPLNCFDEALFECGSCSLRKGHAGRRHQEARIGPLKKNERARSTTTKRPAMPFAVSLLSLSSLSAIFQESRRQETQGFPDSRSVLPCPSAIIERRRGRRALKCASAELGAPSKRGRQKRSTPPDCSTVEAKRERESERARA